MSRRWLYICLAAVSIAMNIAGCSGTEQKNSSAEGTTQEEPAKEEKKSSEDGTVLPGDARIGLAFYPGAGNEAVFTEQFVGRVKSNLESAGVPTDQIIVMEAESGGDPLLHAIQELTQEPVDVIIAGNASQDVIPQITDAAGKAGAALLYFGRMPEQAERDRWAEGEWRVSYVGSDLSKVGELRAQIMDTLDFDEVDANEDHHIGVVVLNTEEDSIGNEVNRASLEALEKYHYTVEFLNEEDFSDADDDDDNDDDRDDADNDADDNDADDADNDADDNDADNDDNDRDGDEDEDDGPDLNEQRREMAREKVSEWINEYGKDLEVILCADDALTLGAREAVEDYKSKIGHDVVILGFSPDAETLEKVAGGEIEGTIFNDSLSQSRSLTDAVLAYLRGESVPQEIICDYVKVTVDNAQEIIDVSSVNSDDDSDDESDNDESDEESDDSGEGNDE